MTKQEYLTAFLERIAQEGPYLILSFTLEDEETEQYWLTLQLPEPYDSFQGKDFLFALMFDQSKIPSNSNCAHEATGSYRCPCR